MSDVAKRATPANSLMRRERNDPATLDLHNDRHNERPPARTLAEEAPQLDADLFLNQSLVGPFFNARSMNHFAEESRAVAQHFCTAGILSEAAADHVGVSL